MQFDILALLLTLMDTIPPTTAIPISLHNTTSSCDALGCVISLGPTGLTCVAAAVEGGTDAVADASCIAILLSSGINAPVRCAGCGTSFQTAIDSAEKAASTTVKGILGAIGDIF